MQIDSKYIYRVPLKYFCNVGKINFPRIDLKIRCRLQTEMKKLFESKKNVTAIGAPDVQNSHILLMKNFRQYHETMLLSKVLQMGIQKAPY